MESFSLLKYWRAGGRTSTGAATTAFVADSVNAKTVVAAADSSDEEDGPYFDLEFAIPGNESDVDDEESEESDRKTSEAGDEDESESEEICLRERDNDDDDEEEEEVEGGDVNFAVDNSDQNVAVSPSDEIFLKGDLVSIEPDSSEENSKLPIFLVKSATKFRVLMLKLKKSKSNGEKSEEKESEGRTGKSLDVKFKAEEIPLVSLFTRENSSKENNNDDRKVMHKYLKMVKPFYIRVSKRYVEKLKFSGHSTFPGAAPPPEKSSTVSKPQQKQGTNNLQAGLRVVRKHLGKSRSASATVSAASPGKTASERRDDSLLQVQDGIQGAILHCKRSFNASREVECSSTLSRSVSDPSWEAKNCKN